VYMCVCVCIFIVFAFHEVRGAGHRSYLSFLRMVNEDVTKGFLLFTIIRDFHVDGAQNSPYVNYVAVFFYSCFLLERSWCRVHRHVIVPLSLFLSCFPCTLCILH